MGGNDMSKICCFTGHRKIDFDMMKTLPDILDKVLESLIWQGVTVFRAGGAIGFDTVAALAVIEKKSAHPEITLELELPCKDQTDGWNASDKRAYEYVLSKADKISYAFEKYRRGCIHERNRRLVNDAQFCVAFCSSDKGGSAYTLNYAKENGLTVINVYDIARVVKK
jgi:uncharacterized phage-like protein YoqJ